MHVRQWNRNLDLQLLSFFLQKQGPYPISISKVFAANHYSTVSALLVIIDMCVCVVLTSFCYIFQFGPKHAIVPSHYSVFPLLLFYQNFEETYCCVGGIPDFCLALVLGVAFLGTQRWVLQNSALAHKLMPRRTLPACNRQLKWSRLYSWALRC